MIPIAPSVVQWPPFSPFLFGGCPTKTGLPKKGFPFFSRVTEQLSTSVGTCHDSDYPNRLPFVLVCTSCSLDSGIRMLCVCALFVRFVFEQANGGDGR